MSSVPRVSLLTSCSLASNPLSLDEYGFYEVFVTFYLQLSLREQKGKVWTRWTCDFSLSPLLHASRSWGPKSNDSSFFACMWGVGGISQHAFISQPTPSPVTNGEMTIFTLSRTNSAGSGVLGGLRQNQIDMSSFPSYVFGQTSIEWEKDTVDWRRQPTIGFMALLLSKCYLDQNGKCGGGFSSGSSSTSNSISSSNSSSVDNACKSSPLVYIAAMLPTLITQAIGLSAPSDKEQTSLIANAVILHSFFPEYANQLSSVQPVRVAGKIDFFLHPNQAILLVLCITASIHLLDQSGSAYLDVQDIDLQQQKIYFGNSGYYLNLSCLLLLLHICVGSLQRPVTSTDGGLYSLDQIVAQLPLQISSISLSQPVFTTPVHSPKRPGLPIGPVDMLIHRLEEYFDRFFLMHPVIVLKLFHVPQTDIDRVQALRLPAQCPGTPRVKKNTAPAHEIPAPVYLHLTVLGVIGEGSFGCVYAASRGSEKVALKVQRKDPGHHHHAIERRLLSLLNHPAVPKLFGAWESATHSFQALEYAPGGSLLQLLQTYPRGLPANLALYYVASVTELLVYLHEQGLVWADQKSENQLVRSNGTIVAADYGLSFHKSWLKYTNLQREECGTESYMAPELLLGRHRGDALRPFIGEYDVEAFATARDVWALGVLACELFCGAGIVAHADDPVEQLLHFLTSQTLPPQPPLVAQFVRDCCVPSPQYRPSAASLLTHPLFTTLPGVLNMPSGTSVAAAFASLLHASPQDFSAITSSTVAHAQCPEQGDLPVSYQWNCFCAAQSKFCGCFIFNPSQVVRRTGYSQYSPSFQSGPASSPSCRGQFSPSFATLLGTMDHDVARTPKLARHASPFSSARNTEHTTPRFTLEHTSPLQPPPPPFQSLSQPNLTPSNTSRALSDYGKPQLHVSDDENDDNNMDDSFDHSLTPLLIDLKIDQLKD